jgi:hypothetical protein
MCGARTFLSACMHRQSSCRVAKEHFLRHSFIRLKSLKASPVVSYGVYHGWSNRPFVIRYSPPRNDWCIDESSVPAVANTIRMLSCQHRYKNMSSTNRIDIDPPLGFHPATQNSAALSAPACIFIKCTYWSIPTMTPFCCSLWTSARKSRPEVISHPAFCSQSGILQERPLANCYPPFIAKWELQRLGV